MDPRLTLEAVEAMVAEQRRRAETLARPLANDDRPAAAMSRSDSRRAAGRSPDRFASRRYPPAETGT